MPSAVTVRRRGSDWVEGRPGPSASRPSVAGTADVLGGLQEIVVAEPGCAKPSPRTLGRPGRAIGELLGFATVAAEESRRQGGTSLEGRRRKSLRSWLTERPRPTEPEGCGDGVAAAGGVVWRRGEGGGIEVGLVHRPR